MEADVEEVGAPEEEEEEEEEEGSTSITTTIMAREAGRVLRVEMKG